MLEFRYGRFPTGLGPVDTAQRGWLRGRANIFAGLKERLTSLKRQAAMRALGVALLVATTMLAGCGEMDGATNQKLTSGRFDANALSAEEVLRLCGYWLLDLGIQNTWGCLYYDPNTRTFFCGQGTSIDKFLSGHDPKCPSRDDGYAAGHTLVDENGKFYDSVIYRN